MNHDAVVVQYRIDFYSVVGVYLGSSAQFVSLDYTRRENYETSVTTIWAGTFFEGARKSWIRPHVLLTISARINNGRWKVQEKSAWVLLGIQRSWSPENGDLVKLIAPHINWLLSGRVAAYASGSPQVDKDAGIDEIAKQIFRENFGTTATAGRNIASFLSVADDLTGKTATVRYAFSYRVIRRVLDTLAAKSFENGTVWLYDVMPLFGGNRIYGLKFITFTGVQGVARRLSFSPEAGNVLTWKVHDDYRGEVNAVYVGGSGQGAARTFVSAVDDDRAKLSPLRRREKFINEAGLSLTSSLRAVAEAGVELGRPITTVELTVSETPGSIYGIDWAFGDSVQYQIKKRTGRARVAAVSISVKGNARQIQCYLTNSLPVGHQYDDFHAADIEL